MQNQDEEIENESFIAESIGDVKDMAIAALNELFKRRDDYYYVSMYFSKIPGSNDKYCFRVRGHWEV